MITAAEAIKLTRDAYYYPVIWYLKEIDKRIRENAERGITAIDCKFERVDDFTISRIIYTLQENGFKAVLFKGGANEGYIRIVWKEKHA